MSLNKNDRKQITKDAINDGYRVNSTGTKLINRETNREIRFSETGGSAYVGTSHYNTPNGVKNSRNR